MFSITDTRAKPHDVAARFAEITFAGRKRVNLASVRGNLWGMGCCWSGTFALVGGPKLYKLTRDSFGTWSVDHAVVTEGSTF